MTVPPPERPLHLRPSMLVVVVCGGIVGTAAREGLSLALPSVDGVSLAIPLVNLVGAFVLGVLLEALLRRGPDVGRRRLLRLGVGTGFCGGFTTYSTLAIGVVGLHVAALDAPAAAYALGSVVLGVVAAWLGVLVGSRR